MWLPVPTITSLSLAQWLLPLAGHCGLKKPVEGRRFAFSHTSGMCPWRGWAARYPTHRALARGGGEHLVLPHIGQALRSRRASPQSPWLALPWGPGRERHLYFNMALVGTALTRRGAVQVFLLFHPFQVLGTAGHHHRRSPGLDLRTLGGGIYLCQPPRSVFQWPKVLHVHEARLHWGWPGGHKSDGSAHQSPW
jgi:hypothetical protein